MTRYAAVIFDLDGVICHTDRYHYKAWKTMADSIGVYFDETINNRLRGVSRMESLKIVLERYDGAPSPEEIQALADTKNRIYVELLQYMTPDDVSAEVRGTLLEIRRRGIRTAIGSSSRNAGTILQRIGLADWFDAVSDGNNIARSKPDPEVFIKAAEFLRLEPAVCLVVEDARAGVDAAAAGGFASAAIGDAAGYGRATYSLNRFTDLLDILV